MSDSERGGPVGIQTDDTDTEGERHGQRDTGDATVRVERLGGIEELAVEFPRGVSLLAGENATNRTSLLRSLAAALGGEESAAALKTDAADGLVELAVGDARYARTYTETATGSTRSGEPYCDRPELVDTFVALFADNPARRAVRRGDDLRELLMRPVDTEEMRRAVTQKQEQRSALEAEVERIRDRERELPGLEEDRQHLRGELDELTAEIEEVQARANAVEPADGESEVVAGLREELEDRRDELRDVEDQLETVEQKIEFRRTEREELTAELEDVAAGLEEVPDADRLDGEVERLDSEIRRLESQRRNLQAASEDLQTVVEMNETISQGELDVPKFDASDDPTAALDPDSQRVECWTCGTEVERERVTERIDTLRELVRDHREQLAAVDQQLDELRDERSGYESEREAYAELRSRHRELSDRVERHDEELATLEGDREALQDDVAELEVEIDSVEEELSRLETADDDPSEFVETHQRLTELERERGRLESTLAETTDEIEAVESLQERRESKEAELSALTDELEQLRGQIDRLETQLVETLNEMLEDLVERLEYRNIARVWVERKKRDGNDESTFELHVVREGRDGTVYEDTVETLSESEREVVGLVVALAGYLVHDIDETVPFILVDSVEMIDAPRLASLLQYTMQRSGVEFLVTALLLKDAAAVEDTNILSGGLSTHRAEFS